MKAISHLAGILILCEEDSCNIVNLTEWLYLTYCTVEPIVDKITVDLTPGQGRCSVHLCKLCSSLCIR
jgi:hypothetical protein